MITINNKEDYVYINIITPQQVHLISNERQIIFLSIPDTIVDGLTFQNSTKLKEYLGIPSLTFAQLDLLFPPE